MEDAIEVARVFAHDFARRSSPPHPSPSPSATTRATVFALTIAPTVLALLVYRGLYLHVPAFEVGHVPLQQPAQA